MSQIVKLGKEKEIEISPWKTRTKKDFIKAMKDKKSIDGLDEEEILNILLYPYIEPKDIYLNDAEKQYLIVKIRDISMKSEIDFSIKCSSCGEIIDVSCNILDMVDYSPNKYEILHNDILWTDIENKYELQKNKMKYQDYLPQTIEMLSHIKKYKNKEVTLEEMVELYEDFDLSESDKIVEDYNKIKSKLELRLEVKCDKCNSKDTYYFETIPKLFDPLLPKEV